MRESEAVKGTHESYDVIFRMRNLYKVLNFKLDIIKIFRKFRGYKLKKRKAQGQNLKYTLDILELLK